MKAGLLGGWQGLQDRDLGAGLSAGTGQPWCPLFLALVENGRDRLVYLTTILRLVTLWAQDTLLRDHPCFPPLFLCFIHFDKVKFLWWE